MTGIDHTHDPAATSWVDGADGHHDFPIQNLPYGVFSAADGSPRPAVAIGEKLLDLSAIAALLPIEVKGPALNALFALPPERRQALRYSLFEMLSDERHRAALAPHLVDRSAVTMRLPATIGDYTDFYVGIHHANNIGRQFRPDNPLLPNYKYVPIGYHGRASSIRPSGVPVVRPRGQRKSSDADTPVFGPSVRLDYELEIGVWIGRGNELGEPIAIGEAADHIAGFCLLNDWSARDIQGWEYQPLGPFLGKSFSTTISPWLVTAEALEPFRQVQPPREEGDPAPLPYLWDEEDQRNGAFAIDLEVLMETPAMREKGTPPQRLSRVSATKLYWTPAQMVTHHSSGGCNLRPGDLFGSGTISGVERETWGSLLEQSAGGRQPLTLASGETRRFLEDGDEIVFRASCQKEGFATIGFGECRGRITSA